MKVRMFFLILLSFLFFSCKTEDSEISNFVLAKSFENVEKLSAKENKLVCYVNDDSGFIEFNSGEKISFQNITEKTIVRESISGNETEILYIPLKPFLVITYDDCPNTDYEVYKNVHKAYSPVVPAELGLNIERCALSFEELKERVNDGFEIVNHGLSHNRLEAVSLQKSAKKGTNKIYGWFAHTFLDNAEILIGDEEYKIISHSSDSDGQYFTVDKPLKKDCSVGTKIRLTGNFLENELFGKVEEIENKLNTKINHFTYPYTVSDERTRSLLKNRYFSSRAYNGWQFDNSKNLTNPGFNYFPFNNKFTLNSASFDTNYTNREVEEILKIGSMEGGNMIVLFTHTWDERFSHEKIKFIIDIAKSLNIEISTRSKIWEYYELY